LRYYRNIIAQESHSTRYAPEGLGVTDNWHTQAPSRDLIGSSEGCTLAERNDSVADRTALELLPFGADERFELLDLGAGTGLLSVMIAEAFPNARLTLFDLTPEMLTIARQRLKPLGKRVKFVTADFAKAVSSKSYNAVVSALAIHHLPDSGKRHLFADIFKYLTSGGVFINADQVAGEVASRSANQEKRHANGAEGAHALDCPTEIFARASRH